MIKKKERKVREKWSTGIILLFSLLLIGILYVLTDGGFFTNDGIMYVTLGENIVKSGQFSSSISLFPPEIQPFLYPMMTGLFSLIFSKYHAAMALNGMFFVLFNLIFYAFLRYLKTERPISLSLTVMMAMIPTVLYLVSAPQAEISSFLMKLCLIFLTYYMIVHRKQTFLIYLFLVMILFILIQIRVEQVFFVMFFLIVVPFLFHKKKWAMMITGLGLFAVLFLLQGWVYYQRTGVFSPFPKINMNMKMGQLMKAKRLQGGYNIQSQEELSDLLSYHYDPMKEDVAVKFILQPSYFDSLLKAEQSNVNTAVKPSYIGVVPFVLKNGITALYYLFLISPVIFILLGVFLWKWRKISWQDPFWILVSIAFLGDLYFLVSHVESRFVVATFPWMVLGVGKLLADIKWRKAFIKWVLLLLIIHALLSARVMQGIYHSKYGPQLKMREWLKEDDVQGFRGKTITARDLCVPFFLDGAYYPLPVTDARNLRNYCKKFRIELVVLGKEVHSTHKELAEVYDGKNNGFMLISERDIGTETLRMFRVIYE